MTSVRSLVLVAMVAMLSVAVVAQEESAQAAAAAEPAKAAADPSVTSDAGQEAQKEQAQEQAQEAAASQQATELPPAPPAAGQISDPLALGSMPNVQQDTGAGDVPLTMPPFLELHHQGVVAPNLAEGTHTTLNLDIDSRIKRLDDALERMTHQIQRETAWATTVRDIIQNYQYKYSKVLSSIKSHMTTTKEMRDMLSKMKSARLHEVLEADLNKASRELTELSAQSADTGDDSKSYQALKDRLGLMSVDLQKMSNLKVNKVMHQVQDSLKTAAENSIPKPSNDAIKELTSK